MAEAFSSSNQAEAAAKTLAQYIECHIMVNNDFKA